MKLIITILLILVSTISALAYIAEKRTEDKRTYLFGFIASIILACAIGGVFE